MRFFKLHRNTKCNRTHDGDLMSRVDSLDIERRIRLGITQALSLFEVGRKIQTLVAHLGENEIRRAIDDAGNPLNAISS